MLDLFSPKPRRAQFEQLVIEGRRCTIERRPYQRALRLMVKPNGQIAITAGLKVPLAQIQFFVLKQSRWIDKQLDKGRQIRQAFPEKQYISGEIFPLWGEELTLRIADVEGRGHIEKQPGQMVLYENPERTRDRRMMVRKFYEAAGSELLALRVEQWQQRMQLTAHRVTFRSTKSRWGSCAPSGAISLNWRLAVFPLAICDYVVVHELAHLRHHDHSENFWRLVAAHCPDYRVQRKYLSQHAFAADFLARQSELYE